MDPIRELTITRHNEMIDPVYRIWGADIAIYRFLGGMVAGMMVILGFFLIRGRHRSCGAPARCCRD